MKRWAVLAWALVLLASCSRDKAGEPPARAEDTVTVYAASSLREAFTALAAELERAHPGVEVELEFAGSQALRTRIEQGARADVFASADEAHMEALRAEGRVEAPAVFALGEPVIVVAAAEDDVRSLADLPKAKRIVLGAAEVPIGRYADTILDRAGASLGGDFKRRVEARVVSREPNVRQVLAKVRLGEADAAIVYRTDAMAAPDELRVIAIPAAANVVARYPIARLVDAPHPGLAGAWLQLVFSAEGQRILRGAGLAAPASAESGPRP